MTTDEAQRILDAVNREEMLSLAQELIKIPSFKTEETEVARFLGDFLAQRGYDVQLQEVEPGRFQTIATLHIANARSVYTVLFHLWSPRVAFPPHGQGVDVDMAVKHQ